MQPNQFYENHKHCPMAIAMEQVAFGLKSPEHLRSCAQRQGVTLDENAVSTAVAIAEANGRVAKY